MLPEVGSMRTLCPGTSLPSFSAASTMAFAILSLTEPPTDIHSSLPTREEKGVCGSEQRARRWQAHTEVAFEALLGSDLV